MNAKFNAASLLIQWAIHYAVYAAIAMMKLFHPKLLQASPEEVPKFLFDSVDML